MKHTWLAALLIGILPAMTFAGDHYGGRYDRGDRYHDSHSSSHSFFGFSLGFASHDFYSGFSYRNYDYPTYHAVRYYEPAPVYCPPPVIVYREPAVVYREPAYCPPPVVYRSAPSYYYAPPVVSYGTTRYYYGR